MVSPGLALVRRNFKTIKGAAANSATSAPSILKPRSGIGLLRHNSRLGPEIRKEASDFPPHFRPPGQSPPVDSNQADQLIARVNRDDVILRRSRSARLADAVYQQGFNVGLQLVQFLVGLHNAAPCLQR